MLKILCRGHILLMILTEKKLSKVITEKNWKKNRKEFRIEKVIYIKDNKFYVKSKEYNNFFNSWIDKKNQHNINEWIFSKIKISSIKCKSWIRFV